jgi:hypothetical protein
MPKERLHLLLADLTLQRLDSLTGRRHDAGRWKTAFLQGSISPDSLFYDLPYLKLSAVGGRLHGLMKPSQNNAMPEPMRGLLEKHESVRNFPWLLGMAHHFMVDNLWHPLINGYADLRDTPCRTMGLGWRECHHWLESELESFWLSRWGFSDGYLPFLRLLKRDAPFRKSVGEAYAELLKELRMDPAPTAKEISRCSSLQIRLMLEFARPAWARLKEMLLSMDATKYVGALIAPRYPCTRTGIPDTVGQTGIHRLWEWEFVGQTADSITAQFLSLPGWS